MSDSINLTVSPDNQTEFPQIDYLTDYTAIYLPYLIFNVGGFILGTSGNLVVIFTIGLDKHLNKNPAYLFMLNLALSDIGISIFVQTFTNIGRSALDYFINICFILISLFFFQKGLFLEKAFFIIGSHSAYFWERFA